MSEKEKSSKLGAGLKLGALILRRPAKILRQPDRIRDLARNIRNGLPKPGDLQELRSCPPEYHVILSEGVQPAEGWLSPMIDLMERDPDTGLVGCKLVDKDGLLIGSELLDPESPEVNYVCEAESVFTAACLIRTELWEKLGRSADDTLPGRVREAGYRVMYQPASVAIGGTGGTVLKEPQSRRFLIIDHYVPQTDKDAGSRYMMDYMRMFVEKGYHITFLGDNFYREEPYTRNMQQMGIEVLYGSWYAKNWRKWLQEAGPAFDYVMLTRPHISEKYIDAVKACCPQAKLFYMGIDLLFMSRGLRYERTGEEQAKRDAEHFRELELKLMHQCDISIYPSDLELEEIAKIDPELTVRKWPLSIYDEVPEIDYDAAKRQDLLFVGGFTHDPNVDSALWAVNEVMPLVWKEKPEITLHIAGANAPEQIRALAGEHVIVHGYLTIEQLNGLLESSRMEIVPLRYGGGVKGKVVEAMKCGLPVVTTSVGTQGLGGAEQILLMGETAEELARQIIRAYDDGERLKEISRKETAYVRENFSREKALQVMALDFEF